MKLIQISPEQANYMMETGEAGTDLRQSAGKVALILTQDWCPQWTSLRRQLEEMEAQEDTAVCFLEYNRMASGTAFMNFKERVLGNDLVPYIRYYQQGQLVSESNYLSADRLIARLSAP